MHRRTTSPRAAVAGATAGLGLLLLLVTAATAVGIAVDALDSGGSLSEPATVTTALVVGLVALVLAGRQAGWVASRAAIDRASSVGAGAGLLLGLAVAGVAATAGWAQTRYDLVGSVEQPRWLTELTDATVTTTDALVLTGAGLLALLLVTAAGALGGRAGRPETAVETVVAPATAELDRTESISSAAEMG